MCLKGVVLSSDEADIGYYYRLASTFKRISIRAERRKN